MRAQSCLTLCDPTNCSPSVSSVRGISQARILRWVANLLQGIFLNQGLKPSLAPPALQASSLLLRHQEKPPRGEGFIKYCLCCSQVTPWALLKGPWPPPSAPHTGPHPATLTPGWACSFCGVESLWVSRLTSKEGEEVEDTCFLVKTEAVRVIHTDHGLAP